MNAQEARKLANDARETARMMVRWIGPVTSTASFDYFAAMERTASALDALADQVERAREDAVRAARLAFVQVGGRSGSKAGFEACFREQLAADDAERAKGER